MTTGVLVASESGGARTAAAGARIRAALEAAPGACVAEVSDVASRSFSRDVARDLPASGPAVVWLRDLHEAFPAGQTGSTRFVLTQSTYQLQRWFDWAGSRGDVTLIADADSAILHDVAPEARAKRGPWRRFLVEDEPANLANAANTSNLPNPSNRPLVIAFTTSDPDERLALCRREVDASPDDAVAHLALGSAYMEVRDLDAARAAIEASIRLAPDWEAGHFEHGKLWLRFDDMERACLAFAEAGRLMPSFPAAFSNLGATLGELDRPLEALEAFEKALAFDPNGYTILNNVGVVSRELGRLPESEAAFRRVISLAPGFVFGHYNLGHTLFLQGRYQAALSAYEEGQRRDPEKNARQACRLAVVRLAAGDSEGALRDLQRYSANLPPDLKPEVLGEVQEILWALLTDQPALEGWRTVADFVKRELETT